MKTSVNKLSAATGFSRNAIQARLDRFGLGDGWEVKDVIMLRPLDGEAMTLDQARTRESKLKGDKLEVELQTLNGERLDVTEFQTVANQAFNEMRATIDASATMSLEEKNNMIDALHSIPERLGWGKEEEE